MGDESKQRAFSHVNSRKFEELVKKIFKLEFRLQDRDILLTQMTRDGGKDVEIFFKHGSVSLSALSYKVWVEAKLKKKSNEVKLNDIAGNVIIAFNSNIKTIYFITTTNFTQQAYKQLIINRLKTGLDIILIDGFKLRNLLIKWKNELKEFDYFISELKKNIPTEPTKIMDNLVIHIDNDTMELRTSIGKEHIITSRKIDVSSIVESEEKYDLSQKPPAKPGA